MSNGENKQSRNLYIVVEGIGGSGKDVVLNDLARRFGEKGYQVVTTREPGGTVAAEILREELFERKRDGRITPEEELRYVFTAREINMQEVVLPALARKELTVVLKARDYLTSFIYQVASGADRDLVSEFYRLRYEVLKFPKPNLRLLLLLDAETAMKRRTVDGAHGDGFDLQSSHYWKAVADGYYAEAMAIEQGYGLFRRETETIDASYSPEDVCREAWEVTKRQFGLEEIEDGELRGMIYKRRR